MGEPKYDEEELAEQRSEMRAAEASREGWAQRWLLSLAVVNAGALLATASILLDPARRTWMLVPSAWLFLGGLFVAGIIPVFAVARYENLAQVRWSQTRPNPFRITHKGLQLTEEEYRIEASERVQLFRRLTRLLSAISALCFILGAVCGLWLLTNATLGTVRETSRVSPHPPTARAAPPADQR